VHDRYGPPDLLQLRHVEAPRPAAGEILVRVHCSTVNRTDVGFLRAEPFVVRFFSGLVRPRHVALGCEFAGEVVGVGEGVTRFVVGDRVFGFDDAHWGGHAELKVIGQNRAVATIPDGIGWEQAAAGTEGAHYAWVGIRAAQVRAGHRVLVHGATGAIGSAAVQLLGFVGAHVVATSTTSNVQLVESLGADRVIDWEREDFTQCDERFDLVLDAVGKSSFGACKHLLVPGGQFISTDLGRKGQNLWLGLAGPLFAAAGAKRVRFPYPRCDQAMVAFLGERLAAGDFRPVIDRVCPLDDIVEAFRYVEEGHKTGNVVIRLT
jgi:NADPH:quinone reductase-like Zn-dependent oxidoreductase